MADIEGRIRKHLKRLVAYKPIEPVEVLSGRVTGGRVIKLDGNENPYGCSPRVREALASYPYHNIYPDPEQRELRKALDEYLGIPAQSIVVGAGSDELIDLILRLFLDPGDKVINCVPTFGMYSFSTGVCGGEVVEVVRSGFALDIDRVKQAIDARTKIIFVASPNNPSGNTAPEAHIRELAGMGPLVVVDEAYAEFCGTTVLPLVDEFPNLIVLRTFSKWAGLAGLRVGYGVFPPEIAAYIMKIKPPYNVNSAAQVAVLESLKDIDYLRDTVRAIVSERERLFGELQGLGFLKPYPSEANFILCSVQNREARSIHEALARKGIFVRYFDTPLLKNCLRISVGRPEDTDALIEALREM
ncbi:MAG: histidinol-phosphate transaminase [Dehalococcoidia bacterium]